MATGAIVGATAGWSFIAWLKVCGTTGAVGVTTGATTGATGATGAFCAFKSLWACTAIHPAVVGLLIGVCVGNVTAGNATAGWSFIA